MLALDIWYNFLYKKIDAQYAFEDGIAKNPMSRFLVRTYGDIVCEQTGEDAIVCVKPEG